MLIDIVLGYNEIDLLELRYQELREVVDRFYVVEHSTTFRGRQKPYYLAEYASSVCANPDHPRFAVWFGMLEKVRFVQIGDFASTSNPWERERRQRDQAWAYVQKRYPRSAHTYMWSDLDEIPSAAAVREALANPAYVIGFRQAMHYGSFLWKDPYGWVGTRMIKPLSGIALSGQEWRNHCPETVIDGGWHCSYFGGSERIKQKTSAYSHAEWDTDEGRAAIEQSLRDGMNPFSPNQRMVATHRDDMPAYVWLTPHMWGLERYP